MKTAMEELIKELYYIQELPMVSGIIKRAELLLEKEKEQIINAFNGGRQSENDNKAIDHYNFNYKQNK